MTLINASNLFNLMAKQTPNCYSENAREISGADEIAISEEHEYVVIELA